MHHIRRSLQARIVGFARDERGVISTEAVIITPLLLWVFFALFVYWDAFRAETATVRATYTVADMISRENAPINNAFITGMHRVYRYMVATPEATWMRVTSVRYNQNNDSFTVLWSRTTRAGAAPQHSFTTINQIKGRIPRPAHDDTLIVVESWRDYTPALKVGVSAGTFYEINVTRPRFLSPLPIS